jgi:hypothetical protein
VRQLRWDPDDLTGADDSLLAIAQADPGGAFLDHEHLVTRSPLELA